MPKGANLTAQTRAKGHAKMRTRALAADHALLARLERAGDVATLALELGLTARAVQLRVNRAKRRTTEVVDGLGVPTTHLVTGRHKKAYYSDNELLDAVIVFRLTEGHWPSRQEWVASGRLPVVQTIYVRFGRWANTLHRAQGRYRRVPDTLAMRELRRQARAARGGNIGKTGRMRSAAKP
jgi:hypothetical protein